MFSTELEFVKKILKKEFVLPYHAYALSPSFMYKKRSVACRKIIVDKSFNFSYQPGPYLDANVLVDAYALQYKNCPSDSSNSRSLYFGDIRLPLKDKKTNLEISWDKKEFVTNLSAPLSTKMKMPSYMVDFKNALMSQADSLWEYINKESLQAYSNRDAEGIKDLKSLYIHFDLNEPLGVEHWYQTLGSVELMDMIQLENKKEVIFEYIADINRYAIKKSLIHTLVSGEEKSDNQFPGFSLKNRYKSLSLGEEDLRPMFYHSRILQACMVPIPKSNPYHFRIIPEGAFNSVDAESYLIRLEELRNKVWEKKEVDPEDLDAAESQVKDSTEEVEKVTFDPSDIFNDLVEGASKSITSFNIILVRDCGKVFMNVSEMNNISKSFLLKNLREVRAVLSGIQDKYKLKFRPTIPVSFFKIHEKTIKEGKATKEKAVKNKNKNKSEKFQQKLVNTLFKVYRGAYYGDSDLTCLFLEKALFDIRANGFTNYRSIRISYEVLKVINQNKQGGNVVTKSMELGKACGSVSWPLVFLIGSYRKSQIGYIRSRILTIQDVRKFLNESFTAVSRHYDERKTVVIDGREINLSVIKTDGASYHEANKILEEMEAKDFIRDEFISSFLDQITLKEYFATKNK